MSTIHQIYCTHCTHGSSALERREGDLGRRMLGYSARAGSLEARSLRGHYRQIERYVYYYLPRDTPAEEKLRLTAATAPRRLVYHPATGGMHVFGQVCYRQTDSDGRPGSYFAHMLSCEENHRPDPRSGVWSALHALRLWGAPGWVDEDSPNLPFLIRPLGSLDQMLQGHRPGIDDRVFESFLTAPAGGPFDDPLGIIPKRWRTIGASERCRLFNEAFRGFFETCGPKRTPWLIVAEPSVAALFFYGVVRLLPPGKPRERISFSTFEPNTDRLGTTLAATLPFDPHNTELPPDAYRAGRFALNTFSNRRSEFQKSHSPYAQAMVRRLLDGGWAAVDRSLANLSSAGADTAEDIEAMAQVDRVAVALLDPRQPPPGNAWRRSPMAGHYFRRAVAERLAALPDAPAALEPIVGRPAHLTILELVASDPPIAALGGAIGFLLKKLPGNQISDLLKIPGIPTASKVEVLARWVASHGELPPGCERLWADAVNNAAGNRPSSECLLAGVLGRLDPEALVSFYQHTAERQGGALLLCLVHGYRNGLVEWAGLEKTLTVADDATLLAIYREHGPTFFQGYPGDEPTLGKRLSAMVGSLAGHFSSFSERVDVLLAGRVLLPDEDQNVLTGWASCRRAILDIGDLQERKSGPFRRRPIAELERTCRKAAEAITRAMPRGRIDDPGGTLKQNALRKLGRQLLGGKPFLPENVWQYEALWRKIDWFFQHGQWPSSPLRRGAGTMRSRSRVGLVCGIGAALLLGAGAILCLWFAGRADDDQTASIGHGPPSSRQEEAEPERNRRSGKEEPVSLRPNTTEPRLSSEPVVRREHMPAPVASSALPNGNRSGVERRDAPGSGKIAADVSGPDAKGLDAKGPGMRAPSTDEAPPSDRARPRPKPGAFPDDWKELSAQFAAAHAGRFFDEEPVEKGTFAIPPNALPEAPGGTELFLGGGVLYFENAEVPFGGAFSQQEPVRRHEIPQLATALGFPSVYVELREEPAGPAVRLDLVPHTLPADANARKRSLLAQLDRDTRKMAVELRAYQARSASKKQQDESLDKLIALTGIEIPEKPRKPSRQQPEFKENPTAYQQAMREYDEAVVVRDRALDRVVPLAKRAIGTVDQKKQFVKNKFRRAEEEMKEHNRKGLITVRDQCRRLSVLVYHGVAGQAPENPADEGSDARGQSNPSASSDADLPSPARVRAMLTGVKGRRLPSWHREKLEAESPIVGLDASGFLLRTTRVKEIEWPRVVAEDGKP